MVSPVKAALLGIPAGAGLMVGDGLWQLPVRLSSPLLSTICSSAMPKHSHVPACSVAPDIRDSASIADVSC